MTISFHLDADDLDAIPFNHAHANQVANDALIARQELVDRLMAQDNKENDDAEL